MRVAQTPVSTLLSNTLERTKLQREPACTQVVDKTSPAPAVRCSSCSQPARHPGLRHGGPWPRGCGNGRKRGAPWHTSHLVQPPTPEEESCTPLQSCSSTSMRKAPPGTFRCPQKLHLEKKTSGDASMCMCTGRQSSIRTSLRWRCESLILGDAHGRSLVPFRLRNDMSGCDTPT